MIDEMLLGFIRENPITIGLVIGVLKVIAQETEWVVDNRIMSLLTLKGRKNGNL